MAERDVVLVRHGETEWSRTGRHTGVTDVGLTDTGERQAALTGHTLAGHTFVLVLTSPRRRARQTCELAGLGPLAVIDDDLAEWDYGQYEGLTSAEIEARNPGWSLWRDGCPGGENPAAVSRRADRVIDRCASVDGPVAVFAHGHILRVIGARWVGLDTSWGRALALDTASISVLGREHGDRVIAGWNDIDQLTQD
ncbi:MAG TPA: histidine phosphatase family protein [Acidimicrobiales bacterium]|jgi:probable phosphoglycerate mutase|nr:histidine phosphatase family protein [Acidimicrobiales bacterium]